MDFFTIQNLVLLILGLIVGFIISKLLEKSAINKSIQNAKNEANNILKSAKIEGENIKKDKIFQAKERFLELKSEHEKHILNKEKGLTEIQKRIKDKESQVSNELSINKKNNQSLNDKIASFDKKFKGRSATFSPLKFSTKFFVFVVFPITAKSKPHLVKILFAFSSFPELSISSILS